VAFPCLQLAGPDTGSTFSTYDAAGNLHTKTDARGITVNNRGQTTINRK
jgi:YD repeat-containing protein